MLKKKKKRKKERNKREGKEAKKGKESERVGEIMREMIKSNALRQNLER